jgi:hypothetical protein
MSAPGYPALRFAAGAFFAARVLAGRFAVSRLGSFAAFLPSIGNNISR